jgi:hypothetical protein
VQSPDQSPAIRIDQRNSAVCLKQDENHLALLQLASGLIAFKKARAATLTAAQSVKSCGSACWGHCGVSPRTADV